jgi:hypothetical protein
VRRLLLSMLLLLMNDIYGCSPKEDTIVAKGKSEHWVATINHQMKQEEHDGVKTEVLYNFGKIVYLAKNPPKKIEYQFVYPNAFPIGTSGSVGHYAKNIKEFKIGGGGGTLNKQDNVKSLKERIDKMYILIKWKKDGEMISEKIYLNVQE